MFAAFLHPYPLRGVAAPLLWVFYRLLTQFGRDMVYFLSEDYLAPPETYVAAGRWEVSGSVPEALGYRLPTRAELQALMVEFAPQTWQDEMRARFGGDGVAAWRHLLLAEDERLQRWLEDAVLARQRWLGERFEAMFIWNNCFAAQRAADNLGLPLLHWELGPLRHPQFLQTAYLDMRSVNGGTECAARLRRASAAGELGRMAEVGEAEIKSLLMTQPFAVAATPEFELGVPLQVDDDSNLVAYANGHDNRSLLEHAVQRCGTPSRILVRNHPNRKSPSPQGGFAEDRSPGSVGFIARCERILTINSSVGAEALLVGKPVEVLGDSPYAHVASLQPGSQARRAALSHFFLGYLVPWPLLFDATYVRWRLGAPGERQIAERHLSTYVEQRRAP